MACTTCKRVVQQNNTGVCLGCQKGFTPELQQDSEFSEKVREFEALKEKERELEEQLRETPKPYKRRGRPPCLNNPETS